MKKNIISIKFATIILTSLTIISCSSDSNDETQSNSQKNDLTVAEAHNFLSEYTSAKYEDKEAVIKKFTNKNKIDVNESAVLAETALNEYTPEQLASIIPLDGGKTGILPTFATGQGTIIKRTVEWNVTENTLGLWRVKSFEDITYTDSRVHQALHVGTRFEGVTMGLISWEEFNPQGNIQITGWYLQAVSIVQGVIHVTGWYDTPIDNYCVLTIE